MAAPGASSATSSSPETIPTDMGAQFMMASSAASSLVPNMQAIIARAQAAQQSHHHNIPNSLTGEHVPVRSDSPDSMGAVSDTSDDSPRAAIHTSALDNSIDRRDVEMTQVAAS